MGAFLVGTILGAAAAVGLAMTGMAAAAWELLLPVVAMTGVSVWLWAFIDALQAPGLTWRGRTLWATVVWVLPVVGAVFYLFRNHRLPSGRGSVPRTVPAFRPVAA
jgi:Phospholipase_D-nuclease N-terminal